MENVEHLWNVTQLLVKNNNPQVNELRNYYVRCCKELSNKVELPKQIFGPNTMCSYCGSLWSTVDSKVRISRGRGLSNSIQKLVQISSKNSSNLTKYQKKLMQRCIKKQTNKLTITCSYCKKRNKIILNKPKRQKSKKSEEAEITPRKKKKRNKDKTAGLIINTPNNLNDSQNNENKNSRNNHNKLKLLEMKKGKRRKSDTSTPNNKSKKINVSKLKGMINTTITPSKKNNLHSFLNELG